MILVKSGSCLYLRKAVLLTDDGEHELEHETGQSFHGQTPLCEGEAVLQLHFRNGHASFTETWRQKPREEILSSDVRCN